MGQKYAAYDEHGAITAFYDSVDSPVPKAVANIPVTDAEWQASLSTPGWTVVGGVMTPPSSTQLLSTAKLLYKSQIKATYGAAVSKAITFTTEGGVTKAFDADRNSKATVGQAAQAYTLASEVPTGFYWKSVDNTDVPFTLKDIQGLNAAMASQVWVAFQKRNTQKTAVDAAKSLSAVQAVTLT